MNDLSQHQRNILHSMGIDVWVSKAAQTDECSVLQFWRDQDSENITLEDDIEEKAFPIIDLPKPSASTSLLVKPVHVKAKEVLLDDIDLAVQSTDVLANVIDITEENQIITPFKLGMLKLQHIGILFDTTAISTEEQALVESIAHSLQATSSILHWPIALLGLQQNGHINSYVQGFIDYTSGKSPIILLGELPQQLNVSIQHRVGSLKALLAEPIQKQELWQVIKLIKEASID